LGANVACSAIDWPADIVTGAARPLALNAPPVTAICATCTSLCPEFFTVTACVTVPFTSTFPKFSVVALKESCDVPAALFPLSFTCVEDPCEVIAINVPDADPDVEPVYATVNLVDWPGLINMGIASPEVANSIALDASCVMVTASLPVLVSVAICVAFCPTGTLAKVMSDGEICIASCGVSFAFAVFAKPAQPLTTVPPQVTIANIAAIPHPCRLPAFDSPTPLLFAAFTLAISSPPPLHSVRQSTASTRARNTG
jgi:hypothetical protein